MTKLPAQPVIHEVNTRVWLRELQTRLGRPVGLGDVPGHAWDELTPPGIDTVWLMGVWERSDVGRDLALRDRALRSAFTRALPDVTEEDIAGSPYCIRRYVVDELLGGAAGLASARAELDRRGIGLLLDYVPNHVAPDSPWVGEHPEYFIQGTGEDMRHDPAAYLEVGDRVVARGRDPFFPPWPDVVQLNAFAPEMRAATTDVLARIGQLCDGVRCDMAMLLMNDVFAKTWERHAGPPPEEDFWPAVLSGVRQRSPGMTFVAEAYWDLEWPLQQQGFDFCYDKRLYDRVLHETAETVRAHLQADEDYQRRLVRFLENHDEPRVAAHLDPWQERAAAVMIATLPGATLWHEGQFTGRRTHLPVFLTRRPEEPPDTGLRAFHERLLSAVHGSGMRAGHWRLLECEGWPDNPTHRALLAWCWTAETGRFVVVVNFSGHRSQARVRLPWSGPADSQVRLTDLLADSRYERSAGELADPGLFVDLDAWGAHLFAAEPGRA
ncbi:alpha-amylase [Streptomyces olivaceiscleroticus]|uniref:Alpha-amylase family glycosyl hydrolase n=1 Tax=Streptomyces olivaceiscleroticus TaxID=68245 RepID=A0ABN0ZYP5_9ACTN